MKEQVRQKLLECTPFNEDDVDYFLNYIYDNIQDENDRNQLLNVLPVIADLNKITLKEVISIYASYELQLL